MGQSRRIELMRGITLTSITVVFSYSARSAIIGSTFVARRAGT
jgi:hypothetical protein